MTTGLPMRPPRRFVSPELSRDFFNNVLNGFTVQRKSDGPSKLGNGERGSFFFELGFLFQQKPQCEQRKREVVVPAHVRAHFVLIGPDIAFGQFEQFFDCMTRRGSTHYFAERYFGWRVAQVLPVFLR